MNLAKGLLPSLLLVCGIASGQIELNQGFPRDTIDGIYHIDRWGVGHLAPHFVSPELYQNLAAYEGKFIRLVDTELQWGAFTKSPMRIENFDAIEVLEPAPIELQLKCVPAAPAPGEPFQLICQIKNVGRQALKLNSSTLIKLRATGTTDPVPYRASNRTKYRYLIPNSLRTKSQEIVEYRWHSARLGITRLSDFRRMTNKASVYAIASGDSAPEVVMFRHGLPVGQYEIEIDKSQSMRLLEDGEWLYNPSAVAWLKLDIKEHAERQGENGKSLVVLDQSVRRHDDGYAATVTANRVDGTAWRVLCDGTDTNGFVGFFRAYDNDNREVPIDLPLSHENPPKQMVKVNRTGIQVTTRFGLRDRFETRPFARFELDLVTDEGVETVSFDHSVAAHFDTAQSAFGKEIDGVKMRIRPTTSAFRSGEQLRFFVQFVKESEGAAYVEFTPNDWGQTSSIEIDGQRINLRSIFAKKKGHILRVEGGGVTWNSGGTQQRPFNMPLRFTTMREPKQIVQLQPGLHTLKFTIRSRGGNQTDNAEVEPIIDGDLSAQTVFTIEPAKAK